MLRYFTFLNSITNHSLSHWRMNEEDCVKPFCYARTGAWAMLRTNLVVEEWSLTWRTQRVQGTW